MAYVTLVTSERSISLQTVAKTIKQVLESGGVKDVGLILSPNLDPSLYRDTRVAIVVMTFDPAWVIPYLYLCWSLRSKGKKAFFYTTVEGKIKRVHGDGWIYRDLTFIANSKYTRDRIVEAGGKVERIIYHGVDVREIQSSKFRRRFFRMRLGLKEDDFAVGYIAGGYMRKGHDLFAQVIKAVEEKDPTVKFVVVTDDKGAEKYSNVENAIIIPEFGKLSREAILGLLHAFDLYVQPSLSEGFGLPVLEALASGKPVVHADYNPLSEITTDKTSFRVPVVDVQYRYELGAILYELHYYDPVEMGETIIYAKDQVLKSKDEYEARCLERAKQFDINKTYKFFVNQAKYGVVEHVL